MLKTGGLNLYWNGAICIESGDRRVGGSRVSSIQLSQLRNRSRQLLLTPIQLRAYSSVSFSSLALRQYAFENQYTT